MVPKESRFNQMLALNPPGRWSDWLIVIAMHVNLDMYPIIVVQEYYIYWLFISGDLFNFHQKSDNWENGIQSLNKVIFMIINNNQLIALKKYHNCRTDI